MNHRHFNFDPDDIESAIESNPDAVALGYFEHGLCRWSVAGELPAACHCPWDSVPFAGIWLPDAATMEASRNYGGSTQGLRWLFWLIPFWLFVLPKGVEWGQSRRWLRGIALLALGISVMSVGYAIRNPWTHPWILDALEHLNLYTLTR